MCCGYLGILRPVKFTFGFNSLSELLGRLRQDNATPWLYSSHYQFYEDRNDLHGER